MPNATLPRRFPGVVLALVGLAASLGAQPPAATELEVLPYPRPLDDGLAPDVRPLDRPIDSPPEAPGPPPPAPAPLFVVDRDPPPGFTGPSSVAPSVLQEDAHFVPVEDRWRIGFPVWDRYDKGHPPLDDYPYDVGRCKDPYHQNVLKGDYPILGQNTFFELTLASLTISQPQQVPTQTTPFESTEDPKQQEFFGSPNQILNQEFFSVSLDLFHGDAAFKPVDWRVLLRPVFNVNTISLSELAQVSPDVRKGVQRERSFLALQEWFVERKLADLSPNYDFVSVRIGSQPFVSDFRGFIFNDINRGVRLFGNLEANRDQFNLVYFDQQEKDTNSTLNTLGSRNQRIYIGNFFRQDFIWPGYTMQASVHYNHDDPSFKFDKNLFLVRPDPVGTFQPHALDIVYLGFAGDGHINRINISHQFYYAFGHDTGNPLANCPQDISGMMAAVELSYDRDYARFRTSYFYSSGDANPNNGKATGFDSILDGVNFAGSNFSYWGRQKIPLFGVGLKQQLSLIPDLRSSKFQGQSNFVNPGLHLFNVGFDLDITPKLRMIHNTNFMWFDKVAPLEVFLFQGAIQQFIGADISLGMEYRPLLSENLAMTFGVATLLPGRGFRDLYDRLNHEVPALMSAFAQVVLAY